MYKIIFNLSFFFALLPFVAPIPIGSDTQYPVFILCFIIILSDIWKGQFKLSHFDMYFLFIALLSFVYIVPSSEYDYSIFKRTGLLFGFFIYYTYTRNAHLIDGKYFLVAFYIFFCSIIFHFLYPSFFSHYADYIVRIIKVSSLEGSRGVSGLATEPGLSGGLSVAYILISYLMYSSRKINKRKLVFIVFLSIIMAIMTKSGTASLLLLVLFSSIFIFHGKKFFYLIVFIAVMVMIYLFSGFFEGRGVNLFIGIFKDPFAVFIIDGSVAKRSVVIYVAIESFLQGWWLGHGVGSMEYVSKDILANSNFGLYFQNVYESSGRPISAIALYLVEMGGVFLVLIVWLFNRSADLTGFRVIRITTFFFILASYSILFPPFWILIALTDRKNYRLYK